MLCAGKVTRNSKNGGNDKSQDLDFGQTSQQDFLSAKKLQWIHRSSCEKAAVSMLKEMMKQKGKFTKWPHHHTGSSISTPEHKGSV